MASRLRIGVPVRLAASLLLGVALASASSAQVVTNLDDAGPGSLRQAILDASPGDTITFMLMAPGGTITLASDLPALPDGVTIDATGAGGVTINGGAAFLVFDTDGSDVEVVDLNTNMGIVLLGANDTLTLTANEDSTVDSNIGESGAATGDSLVKEGDAKLSLTGINAFSGDIVINAGTLEGNTGSIPDVDITNDGVLSFLQTGDGTFAGTISGTGSLEKSGAGNLTLMGPQSYSGGTTVSEGTLTGDTDSLQGNIVNDAALVFDQSVLGSGAFAGDISGTGSVAIQQGAGDIFTLTGDNSYEGGTTLDDGTLTGDASALQGNMNLVAATSSLVIDEPGTGALSGDITGLGSVTKAGAGTLILNGSNDYTGGTNVDAGTLIVDSGSLPSTGTTTLMPGTTLTFDQGGNGTFSGTITGGGDVTKEGAGILTIDTAQTYTGDTTIDAGTLELTGSLASTTTIETVATLTGDGMISESIISRGALSPGGGAAEATFTVGGDVTFENGSAFVVNVNDSDGGDLLAVGGAVDIQAGALISVIAAPGDYSAGSTATVITGGGGVGGDFLEEEEFLLLDRTVTEGGGVVTVTLIENGANLADAGQTPNQRSVGTALATLTGSMDPDVVELFDNLNTITVSEAGPVLDSLSGESITAHTTARVAIGERMQRSIHRRMRAILFASDASWTTPAGLRNTRAPVRSARPPDVAAGRFLGERGIGAWIDGYGALGALDGDGNSADLDYTLYGTTLGGDYRLGDHGLAGLAAGYARSDLEVDDRDGEGDADTYQGAAYAAWANRWLFAGVSGRYAFTQGDNERDIDVGTLMRTARADFDSHDYGLRGELAVGGLEAGPVSFEPLAGIEWTHLDREGFDESGAGSLGLDVESETLDAIQLQLGARLHALFEMEEEDAVFIPEIRGYYLRELGDDERRIEAQLAGAPIVITGAEAPKDSGLVGAGWSIGVGRNLRATAEYDLRIDADRMEHVGTLAIRVRF